LKNGKRVLFRNYTRRSTQPDFNDTQYRLYSLDLENRRIERLGRDFMGNIIGYTIKSDGGVYILGQLGTEVQIYTQQSSREKSIHLQGWNGSYEEVASSLNRPRSIAFVYSSFERPKEIYFIQDIEKIQLAQAITNENDLFIQRDIPKAKVYQWKNEQDNRIIEGILHYPPGKFEAKNLSLLVLMHGGPYDASRNDFQAGWYNWAPFAATHGSLVLEPNYCGSTGYGDDFLNEVRYQPLTRPGRDILSGIDQLINDGIVDPNKLALGGYSYGGFLTHWLITQTIP
jgi:dipeptidyl aminopeptidase/acylaminoacyl peptidase